MSPLNPFDNDSQAVTLISGDDEFAIENGLDTVVLSGTLSLTKGQKASKANVLELQQILAAVLKALD